jgi:hypothetical protein
MEAPKRTGSIRDRFLCINALVESFNGKPRLASLNRHWFLSLEVANEKVECWRRDYNQDRPHRALGNVPPQEFATSARALETVHRTNVAFVDISPSTWIELEGKSRAWTV